MDRLLATKNDEKQAVSEAKMPPFEQYQAAKSQAFSTPPRNFSGRQKQARRASRIHTYRCILRLVSTARTHEIPHENPSTEDPRIMLSAHAAVLESRKNRCKIPRWSGKFAPLQPRFLAAW